jgi:large subunit ribosomal protein L18e
MNRIKNDQLTGLITALKTMAIEKKRPLWKTIAVELSKPTNRKREVNIYKLDRYTKDGEIIIVPGKVLGTGVLSKKITVAALQFSETAKQKIQSSKGEVLSIAELMKKHPDAKGVRIMG